MKNKNITFFKENQTYQNRVNSLDTYITLRQCIERELKGTQSLLDIGNGGFFNYDISRINRVVALDLFVDERTEYAHNVTPIQGDALNFRLIRDSKIEQFDTIVIQMLIHHLSGNSPKQAVRNISLLLRNCREHLGQNGKILIIESTVPAWFYFWEKILFKLLYPVWFFPHPLVIQHTPSKLIEAANEVGLKVTDISIIPKGSWVLQFGLLFPSRLTPIQPVKLVLRKA